MQNGLSLENARIVVTRDEPAHGPLNELLTEKGAQVIHWPVVRVEPPEDPEPLQKAAQRAERFDWILFSSARAVEALLRLRPEAPSGPRIAAVGRATASALTEAGWPVDLIAEPARGTVLVSELANHYRKGARVLFPASSIARETIPDGLRSSGFSVEQVTAYRTVTAQLDRSRCLAQIESGRIAAVTFASPSAVRGLQSALGTQDFKRLLASSPAVVIGQTTASALEATGHPPTQVASESSLEGLVRAVEKAIHTRSH